MSGDNTPVSPKWTFELSQAAYGLVCGLVHPSDQIDTERIGAKDEVWEEVRRVFPVHAFEFAVEQDRIDYFIEVEP